MKQVVQHIGSHELELAEVPEPSCRAGGVLVRNSVSLVSAGTERLIIDFANKSLIGKAQQRPDLARKVLGKIRRDGVRAALDTVRAGLNRALPLGYSCAGVVTEVGASVDEFAVGDRVACAGMGYASHAETVFVPKNLTVGVPATVSLEDAAYVTLGAIAIQGVRTAEPRLGDVVAVIGLGLLGQLTVQILKASGCRVMGVDLDAAKVALALEMGAEAAIVRSGDVLGAARELTRGVGVDAAIITAAAETNDPLELAGEIARDRGVVSVVGAVRLDLPRKAYFDKELQLRMSRSYGPGRYDPEYEEFGRDYPIGYVRWTERRNLEEFIRLVAQGAVTPSRLTTHRFPIASAQDAYAIITGKRNESFTGVLLLYDGLKQSAEPRTVYIRPAKRREGRGVAFIGAGNFASSVLLPRFKRLEGVNLVGVCTATGTTAKGAADRFGFGYATTDPRKVLDDDTVDVVVVATRHESHASLAASALNAGKAVFVEKPLAIDESGLDEVVEAQRRTRGVLAVGFNRRFSPIAVAARDAFGAQTALTISYRVNAGQIPAGSWIHDREQGGGRIIGEVCHFVDLVQFLTDAHPIEVFAYAAGGDGTRQSDTTIISLSMSDGSIASILYTAGGDRSYPKERVEIFGAETVAVIDDFRELSVSRDGRVKRDKKFSQAKGFDEEIAALLAGVASGTLPISLESLIATTRATFAIEKSLLTGNPVAVDPASEPVSSASAHVPEPERYSSADAG